MPPPPETAALIALLRLPREQLPTPPAELVQQAGSAGAALEEVLHPPQGQLFTARSIEDLLRSADKDVAQWEQEGLRVVTVLDPDYPDNLHRVHDRPALIFVAGQLTRADDRAVAVIGSRRACTEALHLAGAISHHLATLEYTVVSGLAEGIDTAVHTAALRAAGRTVAVVGTGLRRVYPPQNAALQARIARTAAVVSPFWPDTAPTADGFRRRNAVMSGLSLATVIVAAGLTSGTRVQARAALAHGRPVFLLRRVLGQPWAAELAERPNVFVVDGPAQITDQLEAFTRSTPLVG